MSVGRKLFFLLLLLGSFVVPSHLDLVFALSQHPPVATNVCQDDVWGPGEYCGYDACKVTGVTDMNHDCIVDGLDFSLFSLEYGTTGSGLSADFKSAGAPGPPPCGGNQVCADGKVSAADYAFFVTKLGVTASPCTGVPIPSVCEGTIAVSFSSNPNTIVSTATQTPGTYTAYVVINNISNARLVEYGIQTSSNITILNHASDPGITTLSGGPPCGGISDMMIGTSVALSGPTMVATIDYQLTDSNPATFTIMPACSWSRVRWTTADGSISHDFDTIMNAGINGPASANTACTGSSTPLGTIAGNVYADVANNCVFDSGTDTPLEGLLVAATPGPYVGVTDANGDYTIPAPVGAYTVNMYAGANDPWNLLSDCQSSYAVNVTANTTSSGNDFALKPIGRITGKVYDDLGNDCTFNVGTDLPISGRMIQATPGGYIGFTDANGNYAINVQSGSYTVSQVPVGGDPWALQSCQVASYPVTVAANETSSGNDFALQLVGPTQCAVSVNIVSHGVDEPLCPSHHPWRGPCPGSEEEYLFTVNVASTSTIPVAIHSTLDMTLDPAFTISSVTSATAITLTTSSGSNQQTIRFDEELFGGNTYVVKVKATPTASAQYLAQATFTDAGQCSGTKTASLSQTDNCSCDPNDLAVEPEGCGPNGNIAQGTPLSYTVRFENVGEGVAHNVQIRDTLDADLDLSTLSVISSSPPLTGVWTQIDPYNALVFAFLAIDLPGIGDPANNHGYITFTINPKSGRADGTTISNRAAVRFDYNAPVFTNTTLNTIRDTPSPVAAFTTQDGCDAFTPTVDFTYTGGTADNATFAWDFGPGATPATSTVQNPSGVHYATGGSKQVQLTVTRFGCASGITNMINVANCVPVCHDGVWDTGEYCGYDAYVTTGIPDMTHDCTVDGLDMGLMGLQFGSVGPDLSGDLDGNGSVGLTDLSLLASKYGMTISSGCVGTPVPNACSGRIALSLSEDPYNIVDNETQSTGPHTAYVVVNGGAGAQMVEYTVVKSANVSITSHNLYVPGVAAYSCALGATSMRVFSLTTPLSGDPEVVAEIQYTLSDTGPAQIVISQGPCSLHDRWATAAADTSHDFVVATNVGINGPTPAPVNNSCVPSAVAPRRAPRTDELSQNHPNPFNPATTIEYGLASSSRVAIGIYDVKGHLVRTLVDQTIPAGWHTTEWNGRDQAGNPVASGVYLYRMVAGSFVQTRKLVLLK